MFKIGQFLPFCFHGFARFLCFISELLQCVLLLLFHELPHPSPLSFFSVSAISISLDFLCPRPLSFLLPLLLFFLSELLLLLSLSFSFFFPFFFQPQSLDIELCLFGFDGFFPRSQLCFFN